MNIRSLYAGIEVPPPYERLAAGYAGTAAADACGASLRSTGARAEASHRTRTELAELRGAPEVDGSIKKRMNPVQLTKRQAEELLTRIREGYYLRPEILHTMAAVICSVLQSEP